VVVLRGILNQLQQRAYIQNINIARNFDVGSGSCTPTFMHSLIEILNDVSAANITYLSV